MFNYEYIGKDMQATTYVKIIHSFLVQGINYALLIMYANLNLGLDHSSLNPLYIGGKTFIKYMRQVKRFKRGKTVIICNSLSNYSVDSSHQTQSRAECCVREWQTYVLCRDYCINLIIIPC